MKSKHAREFEAHQTSRPKIEEIYQNGEYLLNHPTLHSEDSYYKFDYIKELLNQCSMDSRDIRILDIGGGAGLIARLVCEYFAKQGFLVECHSFDLSADMLKQQQINNPFNKLATSTFKQIFTHRYDLCLLIDVMEHIPDNGSLADNVDLICNNIIYNIPTEKNLADFLRNLYFKRQYYPMQTTSLGHIHFYSCRTAKSFVRRHHKLITTIFPDYATHLINSDFPGYIKQRESKLRNVELIISRFIFKWINVLAPWLIQGSLFVLAKSRNSSK